MPPGVQVSLTLVLPNKGVAVLYPAYSPRCSPWGLDGLRHRHLISFASSKLRTKCRFESMPGHPVCHQFDQITCATFRRSILGSECVNRLQRLRAVVLLVRPAMSSKRPGGTRHLVGQRNHRHVEWSAREQLAQPRRQALGSQLMGDHAARTVDKPRCAPTGCRAC